MAAHILLARVTQPLRGATVGADRVVLGSDHPFDMGDLRPADTVRSAGLDPHEEAAVLGGNAARLLGLEVAAA